MYKALETISIFLEAFLFSLSKLFNNVCVTLTFIFDNKLNNLSIDSYSFVRIQRQTRGGGVGAYVRTRVAVEIGHFDRM